MIPLGDEDHSHIIFCSARQRSSVCLGSSIHKRLPITFGTMNGCATDRHGLPFIYEHKHLVVHCDAHNAHRMYKSSGRDT